MPATPAVLYDKGLEEEILDEKDETESIIQYFLEAYKNYLVQCIDYKDLLFYKYFCPAKRKAFREMARLQDCESVTREMIDTILAMKSVADRFSALLKLFEEEFENEKVLRILKGEKVPSNRLQNKERIQRVCMKEICENLRVSDIIPELRSKSLILLREADCLLKKARSETHFEAAVDLLLILPSRHTNWYALFMYCLIDTGHEMLAEKVDKDLYQRIMTNKKQAETHANEEERSVTSDQTIEDMSLISGPMKTCASYQELLKHNLDLKQDTEKHITSLNIHSENKDDGKTNGIDLNETTTPNSSTNSFNRSPSEERVVQWVMASSNTGYDSDTELGGAVEYRYQTNSKCKISKRKLIPGRTGSLVKNSASQTKYGDRTYRHQTMQVPFSQIQELTNRVNELKRASTLLGNQGFDEVFGAGSLLSMASECSSIENLCVDNALDLNNIHLEVTGTHQNDSKGVFALGNADFEHEDEELRERANNPAAASESHGLTDRQSSGRKKQSMFPTLEHVFSIVNLHPVKISMILKENRELTNSCKLLSWMSDRAMYYDDHASSLKYHYVSTVIRKAMDAESLDVWIHMLLTGREPDGYYEFQDQLVRQVLTGFPHQESSLLKKLLVQLKMSHAGDGLTSLKILIQGLNRGRLSMGEQEAESAGSDTNINISSKASQMSDKAMNRQIRNCSSGAEVPVTVLNDNVSLIELKSNDRLYQVMMEHISKADKEECYCFKVIKIQSIRNNILLEKYMQLKERLLRETRDGPIERLLFGSPKVLQIMTEGGSSGERHDQNCLNDVYFADYPILIERCEQDMTRAGGPPSSTNSPCGCCRYLLLCRVYLGNSSSTYPVPKDHHSFELRHTDKGTPVYRVLSADQVYPWYLVTLSVGHRNT